MVILETQRLLLRRLVPGDLEDLYRLYSDPEVRRFFPEGTLTREQTWEELEYHQHGHPTHPQLGLWATILKEEQRFIGRCGLLPWVIDGQEEVEIAYLLAKDCWRRGLGSEAAAGILKYAVEVLGYRRLVCMIDHDNQASIGVASKIGMQYEKDGLDELGPFALYTIQV